ncbi:MAG: Hydroxymethylpyrimidine ABC transporter, transmembrane component [Pseudolabrys sp.]|nr:Hydroxymethylpyrimidine ABC transporter, transmembrane component [Pseudolabrys sp.]
MTAKANRWPLSPKLVGLGSLVLFFLLLEAVIRIGLISRYVVPPPSEILESFYGIIVHEHVFRRFLLTAGECLAAGVLITIFGVAGGVLLHRSELLRRACETWVASLAAAPIVLAYPLFMVLFGRNSWTIIIIGFIAGLPPVMLKTLEGIAGTRRVLINVGRSFNLTPTQQFWKIQLPAALPVIFTGIRLGLIFALINVVGVEFLINAGGLGPLINDLAERYDLAGTYAAICFVILVSVLFYMTLERAERWLRPAN